METRLCLAVVLLVPAFAFAECLVDAESDRQLELLREDLRVEALATCLNFLTRQRDFELQLIDRVLTFTNVRSILEAE